ncbi:DNA-binding transcriptional regulator GbsR (MarR family) [Rhizobium sp. RAS22]|nr:DNA-binding transcriptional regulator GbsR (MarR family) [Rhizobium sp. RAS22]
MIDDRKDVTLDEMVEACLLSCKSVSAKARSVPGCGPRLDV